MTIKQGSTAIAAVKVGTDTVTKMYAGADLVYSSASSSVDWDTYANGSMQVDVIGTSSSSVSNRFNQTRLTRGTSNYFESTNLSYAEDRAIPRIFINNDDPKITWDSSANMTSGAPYLAVWDVTDSQWLGVRASSNASGTTRWYQGNTTASTSGILTSSVVGHRCVFVGLTQDPGAITGWSDYDGVLPEKIFEMRPSQSSSAGYPYQQGLRYLFNSAADGGAFWFNELAQGTGYAVMQMSGADATEQTANRDAFITANNGKTMVIRDTQSRTIMRFNGSMTALHGIYVKFGNITTDWKGEWPSLEYVKGNIPTCYAVLNEQEDFDTYHTGYIHHIEGMNYSSAADNNIVQVDRTYPNSNYVNASGKLAMRYFNNVAPPPAIAVWNHTDKVWTAGAATTSTTPAASLTVTYDVDTPGYTDECFILYLDTAPTNVENWRDFDTYDFPLHTMVNGVGFGGASATSTYAGNLNTSGGTEAQRVMIVPRTSTDSTMQQRKYAMRWVPGNTGVYSHPMQYSITGYNRTLADLNNSAITDLYPEALAYYNPSGATQNAAGSVWTASRGWYVQKKDLSNTQGYSSTAGNVHYTDIRYSADPNDGLRIDSARWPLFALDSWDNGDDAPRTWGKPYLPEYCVWGVFGVEGSTYKYRSDTAGFGPYSNTPRNNDLLTTTGSSTTFIHTWNRLIVSHPTTTDRTEWAVKFPNGTTTTVRLREHMKTDGTVGDEYTYTGTWGQWNSYSSILTLSNPSAGAPAISSSAPDGTEFEWPLAFLVDA